jgi:hypothetical protein
MLLATTRFFFAFFFFFFFFFSASTPQTSTAPERSRTLSDALESCRTLQKPQGTKGTRGTYRREPSGNKGNDWTKILRE